MTPLLLRVFSLAAVLAACGGSTPTSSSPALLAQKPAPPPEVECSAVPATFPRSVSAVLNLAPLRGHPLGKSLGPLLLAMPQWKDLVGDTLKDPVREIDWAYVSGPSMVDSSKDIFLVHHALGEDGVDRAVDALRKRSPSVVDYDLDVRGAKGVFANLDQGPRVIVRAQKDVLASAPPEHAKAVARVLTHAKLMSPTKEGEALRAWAANPHAEIPRVPETIKNARVVVVPRADGGLDVSGDGDCADEPTAARTAEGLRRTLDGYNNFVIRLMTAGLLDAIVIRNEGAAVQVRLAASQRQVARAVSLLATFLGADL